MASRRSLSGTVAVVLVALVVMWLRRGRGGPDVVVPPGGSGDVPADRAPGGGDGGDGPFRLPGDERRAPTPSPTPTHTPARTPAGEQPRASSDAEIGRLFRERRSDTWVEGTGKVVKVLPDDRKGDRHQRFLLRLGSGQTLLVAHNIDLAPRVPLEAGDRIDFRGEYEWNDRGGVLHWTHHHPRGRHQGGWLRMDGRVYR